MKKSAWAFVILAIIMVVFVTSIASSKAVIANPDYSIDRVDHTV